MRTIIYFNGDKVTMKEMKARFGARTINGLVTLAREYRFVYGVHGKAFDMGSFGNMVIFFMPKIKRR